MKKVLITGHKGYIGQHLWQMISHTRKDIELYGMDTAEIPTNPFYGDIRSDLTNQKFHTIIHLAALVRVGESVKYPTRYYDTNVNGTAHILNHFNHHNFIFASTGAAEKPESPYGLSKRMAEDIVRENSYDYTTFRFYNVIGTDGFAPTNPDGLMSNLMAAVRHKRFDLYGTDYNTLDGSCIREYIHVNDICKSIIKAIYKPSNAIENLAYGEPKSVLEIINIFKTVNNVEFAMNILPRRDGDPAEIYLTNQSNYVIKSYTYEEMLKL